MDAIPYFPSLSDVFVVFENLGALCSNFPLLLFMWESGRKGSFV